LPATSKWRNGVGKAILKDATQDLLPKNFFRREKTGFVLPLGRWLNHELHDCFVDVLEDRMATQFFSTQFLNRLRQRGSAQTCGHQAAWGVLVFLRWAKKYGIQTA